jgi:UDP-glucose 4-epimerase
MRIVVTGGAGFIGSHVADAFIAAGHEVTVIDNFSTGDRANLNPKAEVHSMDILDPDLPEVLGRVAPRVLCHHAAQMDVRRSVADPQFDARVNILGLIHLLEAGRAAGVRRVIFASSGGAIYGEQERYPAAEDHPTQPASPYGVSKLAGEHYLSYYEQTAGISCMALRYSNVYGPRQLSTGEAGVVAIFTSKLLRGEVSTIYGDGKQTRDYVYVGDVVQANLLALSSGVSGPVNIGTGRETDVLTLYGLLQRLTGSKISALHGPPKVGEQRRSSVDSGYARKKLGWSPATTLEMGLEQTVAFYRHRTAP